MRLEPGPAAALLAEAKADLRSQRATRILIIEDEPIIALDIMTTVERAGHTVTGIAATRAEAVELARRDPPELILADIQLADDSSGLDAVREILEAGWAIRPRRRRRGGAGHLRHRLPERLLTGERPEPTFLITKPFDPDTLQVSISQAMAMRRRPPSWRRRGPGPLERHPRRGGGGGRSPVAPGPPSRRRVPSRPRRATTAIRRQPEVADGARPRPRPPAGRGLRRAPGRRRLQRPVAPAGRRPPARRRAGLGGLRGGRDPAGQVAARPDLGGGRAGDPVAEAAAAVFPPAPTCCAGSSRAPRASSPTSCSSTRPAGSPAPRPTAWSGSTSPAPAGSARPAGTPPPGLRLGRAEDLGPAEPGTLVLALPLRGGRAGSRGALAATLPPDRPLAGLELPRGTVARLVGRDGGPPAPADGAGRTASPTPDEIRRFSSMSPGPRI
jgi:CheY-like chemotaxis protein